MYKNPCIKSTDSGSYELHCEYHRNGRQQELCATTARATTTTPDWLYLAGQACSLGAAWLAWIGDTLYKGTSI